MVKKDTDILQLPFLIITKHDFLQIDQKIIFCLIKVCTDIRIKQYFGGRDLSQNIMLVLRRLIVVG